MGSLGHRDVLKIAIPITLSNATVPLIGFVDAAVIGQLGQPHAMGAVAIGAVIFNTLYWTFSFLRMGTTGLTAQALGAGDGREIAGHLLRALLVAGLGGLAVLALQLPLRSLAFWVTGGSDAVVAAGHLYFDIRIWAAPAGLINFALLGWLIGLGRAGTAFLLQLLLNLLNIALAIGFTLGLGAGVAGVGWAALVAEVTAALAGLFVARRLARDMGAKAPVADAVDRKKLTRSLTINLDIAIRSFFAFSALIAFTAFGARMGDVTLAANGLLINIQSITVYMLDGWAFACEALVGQAIGARDRDGFWRAIRLSTAWAAAFAVVYGVFLFAAGPAIVAFSARNVLIQAEAGRYLAWAALAPIVGVWCFQLDGIFTGATRTRDMRNMMILSMAVFLVAYWVLTAAFANHGLWAAMLVLFVARAASLATRLPALVRGAFGPAPA